MFFFVVCLLFVSATSVAAVCSCNFSSTVSPSDPLFVSCMALFEGRLLGAAYDDAAGVTLDGRFLESPSGSLGPVHPFSAPSKESLHLGILARALAGDGDALLFVLARNCSLDSLASCQKRAQNGEGRNEALRQLSRKMASLFDFNSRLPGYGGFLPWFKLVDGRMVPQDGWEGRVPALDNGEMIWGLAAVSQSLQKSGEEALLKQVDAYLALLASSAKSVFYAGVGSVRAVTKVANETLANPPASNFASEGSFLVDPYEGEMFTQFLSLYGEGVTQVETELMWLVKRPMMQKIAFRNATLQKGWWFSSHEQWKYMFLPYSDSPTNWKLFINGEMARTINSENIPGLFASVNNVTSPSDPFSPAYFSANGISQFAFVSSDCCGDTVTPYGAFSVMLANKTAGLAWWANMASPRAMHSAYGSMESILTDGTLSCPLLTWDAKATSFLAALGGVAD